MPTKQLQISKGSLLPCSLLFMALAAAVPGQQNPSDSSKSGSASPCQRLAIIGAVNTPSRFEFRKNVRLNRVIECVGGLTDKAGKNVQIVHAGEDASCHKSEEVNRDKRRRPELSNTNVDFYSLAAVMRGEEGSNPALRAGDIVVVLESEPVYVVGNVVQPQAILPEGTITLTQAIARAGGVTKYSKTDRIRIIRQTVGSSERTVITIDLKAITRHRALDLILQPFDIIDVPGKRDGWPFPLGRVDIFKDLPLRPIC